MTLSTTENMSAEASRNLLRGLGPIREQAARWAAVHEGMVSAALERDDHALAAQVAGNALRIIYPATLHIRRSGEETSPAEVMREAEGILLGPEQ
jgi:hypothetical protein